MHKPFSTLYYIAFNIWGRFVFVSKNIFLVVIFVKHFQRKQLQNVFNICYLKGLCLRFIKHLVMNI